MLNKGLKRNIIDKFYTKNYIVNMCCNYIQTNLNISYEYDLIIEPSAGNGAFISSIKKLSSNYIFYDIQPEYDEIILQDYLQFDINVNINKDLKAKCNKIHVIGNPPFGRQSSTAIKFIKKSCEFCNSISFILPKSFKKDSLIKHFPMNFHKIFEIDIPEKAFLLDSKEYNVDTVFQIWEKREYNRESITLLEPYHFIFVNKFDNPDISFRRVGVYAGKIETNVEEKSIQSHYFIKFTNNKTIKENIDALSIIKYDFNNTVGPKSISKQELIMKFNPLL
jgi:predicted RNA methylase